ncbi:Crp/Fnr family transcriptional regulator [Taklimakanibacter deserti]|uniref:Crp/Fnr family transcriptional regulator n=1 Tax=Taklimakanibacter deserti TaxID=2267839 RepID=UPI0013C531F5
MTQIACAKPTASLDDVELFSTLPAEERQRLADRCLWHRLEPKHLLIDGDHSSPHGVFVLTEGIVELSQRDSKWDIVPVGWLSAPACFGEFAAIMSCPGAISVRTVTSCEVGELSEETFNRLLSEYPSFSLKLLKKTISIVRALDDDIVRLHLADSILAAAHRKTLLCTL